MMKRNVFLMGVLLCGALLFSAFTVEKVEDVKLDYQDKIELSRQGGTTRSGSPIIVEAENTREELTLHIQNYTGAATVEISGGRTFRRVNFDVQGEAVEVINIATLRAGTYTLRVILDSETYVGILTQRQYGR